MRGNICFNMSPHTTLFMCNVRWEEIYAVTWVLRQHCKTISMSYDFHHDLYCLYFHCIKCQFPWLGARDSEACQNTMNGVWNGVICCQSASTSFLTCIRIYMRAVFWEFSLKQWRIFIAGYTQVSFKSP